MELYQIINKIFLNEKIDISFDYFLDLLKNQSNNSISWKNHDNLYLFYNNWNFKIKLDNNVQDIITKYLNCTIIDNNFKLIMYSGPKIIDSLRDNTFELNKYIFNSASKYYESFEGTIINIFNYNNKWFYTTKRNFDMNDSKFNIIKSHGEMFEDIIEKKILETKLNINYTYQFILIHKDNTNLIIYDKNLLILTSVKDTLNNFNNIDINLDLENISKLDEINLETWDWDDNNKQGIIIYNNEIVYRIYNKHYKLKIKNNKKFNKKQEELIWKFQNNLLQDDEKIIMINVFNYIGYMLYNLYNNRKIINNTIIDYHLDKLYNLSKNNNLFINENKIKSHMKFHMKPNDIYIIFKYFIENYSNRKNNFINKFILL